MAVALGDGCARKEGTRALESVRDAFLSLT